MKKQTILFFFLFLCSSMALLAQKKGYSFTVKINNTADSILYFGNYYANQQFALDTAYINKKGLFVFLKKDKELMPGMYFFATSQGKYFELFIDPSREYPKYEFITDTSNLIYHMNVKGSSINKLFYEYNIKNHTDYIAYDEMNRKEDLTDEEKTQMQKSFYKKVDSTKIQFMVKNPDHLLTKILKATKEIDLPPIPRDDKGNITDSNFQRLYYYEHFFDNLPLTWDGLVRTPPYVFYDQLNRYFDVVLKYESADTITKYADRLIEKVRPSKEVFHYIVWFVTDKYLRSPILGHDAVYVHMIETYYMTGQAFWASPSSVESETKRAMQWKKLLIGKPAPNLVTKDMDGMYKSLYDIPTTFTVLIFWSPDCGHCKTIIPEFHKFYKEHKLDYDMEVYAVNAEPVDKEKWKEFIRTNELDDWINTSGDTANIDWREVYNIVKFPVIYLLDQDKKIIGKQLDAQTTEQIIKAVRTGRRMY